jgi:hypothetical protein
MLSVSLFAVGQYGSSNSSQTGTSDKQAGTTDQQAGATDKQAGATDKKTAKAEKKEAKAAEKGKALSLTGWVKTEGDKVNFVNDKDKQTWSVKNQDVLKPLDGKHVKVKATLDEADHSLTVDNVKELRKGKQSGQEQAKH